MSDYEIARAEQYEDARDRQPIPVEADPADIPIGGVDLLGAPWDSIEQAPHHRIQAPDLSRIADAVWEGDDDDN